MRSNNRRRMAGRYARRAKISGEEGVTISFGFSSLKVAIVAGLLFFHFHRTVLVTDRHVYVFRDLPFHRPGERLGEYPLGAGTATRLRGKLTFADGRVVWHSPLFAWRVRQVAEAIEATDGAGLSA